MSARLGAAIGGRPSITVIDRHDGARAEDGRGAPAEEDDAAATAAPDVERTFAR
jgi:hypothetical protein